jgi:nucleotide-binding universal stress UspA family protein
MVEASSRGRSILGDNMRILVPYDGTEHTKAALESSLDIARENDGLLKVLHVYWDPKVREYGKTEVRDRYSLQILSKIKPRLERSNIKYELLSKHDPDIPKTVIKTADTEDVDLIVLGKQGLNNSYIECLRANNGSDNAVLLV